MKRVILFFCCLGMGMSALALPDDLFERRTNLDEQKEEPKKFSGKVLTVPDADIIVVLTQDGPTRVKLAGIKCPERREPFGRVAKRFTEKAVTDVKVDVKVHETTRDVVVGEVILPSGDNLGHELLKAGLAYWDREAAPDNEELEDLEEEALVKEEGLWGDPRVSNPWNRTPKKPAN